MNYVQKLIEEIGIGSERLEMTNMSAGMGEQFARKASEFTEKIRELGPNPIKTFKAMNRASGE